MKKSKRRVLSRLDRLIHRQLQGCSVFTSKFGIPTSAYRKNIQLPMRYDQHLILD
ncbi:hypothetical protein SCLCIDRAFT_1222582 [Scleroderma citrinum Foug A]|uniref:Uncharacterized protein n=1 Tax=Scleroderma citrinum Foug A TaxID=1036808 RepID=A0A0C3DCB7_9AGAM|nr:hypothetical protein SCLCIDRAFT_1222582 [Scleroderma citrinum Foug A]